jgi:hypothetical protein
VGHLDHVGVVE